MSRTDRGLVTRKIDDDEYEVVLDGLTIGMAYRKGPGQWAGQYQGESDPLWVKWVGISEWERPTLREAAIEVETAHHSNVAKNAVLEKYRPKSAATSSPEEMTPVRSNQIEQWLDSQGVSYTYHPKVAIIQFDVEASIKNQSRLGEPIINDLVDDYIEAMKAGATFPAVIAYAPGEADLTIKALDHLVLIDGNQRLAAHSQAGHQDVDVYLVGTTDESVLDRLTRTANRSLNGDRPGRDAAVAHAIYRIERFGEPLRATAADFGVSDKIVERELAKRRTRARLEGLEVNASRLNDGALARLAAIQSDPVLGLAAELAVRAALPNDEVNALVVEIRKARSESEQVQAIAAVERRADIQRRIAISRGGRVMPPRSAIATATAAIVGFRASLKKHPTPDLLGLTQPGDLDKFAGEVEESIQTWSAWINKARANGSGK